jgi:hypothetical protein
MKLLIKLIAIGAFLMLTQSCATKIPKDNIHIESKGIEVVYCEDKISSLSWIPLLGEAFINRSVAVYSKEDYDNIYNKSNADGNKK